MPFKIVGVIWYVFYVLQLLLIIFLQKKLVLHEQFYNTLLTNIELKTKFSLIWLWSSEVYVC